MNNHDRDDTAPPECRPVYLPTEEEIRAECERIKRERLHDGYRGLADTDAEKHTQKRNGLMDVISLGNIQLPE